MTDIMTKLFHCLFFEWPVELVLSRHTPPTLKSVRCVMMVFGSQKSVELMQQIVSNTTSIPTQHHRSIFLAFQTLSSHSLAPHLFENSFQSLISSIRSTTEVEVEENEDTN